LLEYELNSKFVGVLDPEERETNVVHYFLHPVCVMDCPSCATGPASQWLWLCMAVAQVRWFEWRARNWRDSVGHVRVRVTVSHWQDQYHHIL